MASAYALIGFIFAKAGQYDLGISEAQKAVELDPNCADCYAHLGVALHYAGRAEEAVPNLEKAIRLNPFPPNSYWGYLSAAHIYLGHYADAIGLINKAIKNTPTDLAARISLVLAQSLSGHEKDARAAAEKLLEMNPKFSIEQYKKMSSHKDRAYIERCAAALHKAGLPETTLLPLPDKPSIAVLPFVNMSDDPKQEYFSDGITEEIITALSKTPKLFVIARTSSFKYKGKEVDVRTVGRELGVRYVLEGSVRKSKDRLRITAQLIDAKTGNHLWAERYDRELKDIFALQDEITLKVLTGLQVKLTEGDQALILGKKLKNLDVYLKYLEAAAHFRKGTRESVTRYSQLGQEIIEMAPETAVGYQVLAWYYWYLYRTGTSPRESAAKAFKLAKKTLDMDKSDSRAHALLGSVYLLMRQHEKAIDSGKQAVALNPNGAFEHDSLGSTLTYAGRLDEAIDHLKRAIRLNPFPDYWYFQHLGVCYMLKGQYEEALTEFKKALHRAPDAPVNRVSLAVIYILLDRQEEARAVARKVLDIRPNFSVGRVSKTMPFKNQADLKLVVDAMRKAGLG